MKYLYAFVFLILVVMTAGYIVLFTKEGNAMLTPFLNASLSRHLPPSLPVKLKDFQLTPSALYATLKIRNREEIRVTAVPVSFTPQVQIRYRVKGLTSDLIDIDGNVQGKPSRYRIDGEGSMAGGSVQYRAILEENRLQSADIACEKGHMEKLLSLLGQEAFAKGLFDLKLHLENSAGAGLYGNGKLELEKRSIDQNVLMAHFGIRMPEEVEYGGMISFKIDNSHATGWGALKTTLGNIILQKSRYDFKQKKFVTAYHLYISDLKKLSPLLQHPLRGTLEAEGEAVYREKPVLTGKSRSFKGEIDYRYSGGTVTAVLKNVALRHLLHTLSYPEMMQGVVSGELQYHLPSQSGTLNSSVRHLRFLPNTFTRNIRKYTGTDIAKTVFEKSTLRAALQKKQLLFDVNATGKKGYIRIKNAAVDKTAQTIYAKFEISLDKKEYFGTLSGDLSAPQISFDTARYLQSSVGKAVDQVIDPQTQKQIGDVLRKQLKTLGVDELNSSKILRDIADGLF